MNPSIDSGNVRRARERRVRIAVFGAGGVGGYFGGRLALAGADVHLIARGAHLRALKARGLRVRSIRGDFGLPLPATDDPADVGPCDIVLFAVKSFDTQEAAARLTPLLREATAVVSLQNGVDNVDKLSATIGKKHVMGGTAIIFATVSKPGVIEHTSGLGSLAFGELDGSRSSRGETLLALCASGGIPAELVPDVRTRLWRKFALICALAGVTACTRLPIGVIRETPETWDCFLRIATEVTRLASAEGVHLPNDEVARIAALAESFEPAAFASLYHDLVNGRRLELEALHGFVVRRSNLHGLAAPTCNTVYALLRPHAIRAVADGADVTPYRDPEHTRGSGA